MKQDRRDDVLLANIQAHLPEFEAMLADVTGHWAEEDLVYRFYHQSFKVYWIQAYTEKMVELLRKVDPKPEKAFHKYFQSIIRQGTGHVFERDHNQVWTKRSRLMLEAFWHAKYTIEMAIRWGKEMKKAPNMLPSGWAGVLAVFNLR